MPQTYRQIAARAGEALGLTPDKWPGLQALIDTALLRTARTAAQNPRWANYFLTNRAATTVTTDSNGAANLAGLMDAPTALLLDLLPKGNAYLDNTTLLPFSAPAAARAGSCLADDAGSVYVEGMSLYAVGPDGAPLTGAVLHLSVPRSLSLAEMPDVLAVDVVVAMVMQMAQGGSNARTG